ncbi:MAG TPA: arylsulfotransferase family protein [Solirubrobacteraceae bacterium]|jgi:hypothetical protein|nr:arylsulfotransferase family protein [Solirubrobacteraceae bacterium]
MRGRRPAAAALAAAASLLAHGCGRSSPSAPAVLSGEAAIHAAEANPVTVSPLPGTRDASPGTQISFLGGPGTSVSGVSVRGSRSGAHAGVLLPYSTGTGESFLPRRPFIPGELVRASAAVGSGAAARTAVTDFTVAEPAPVSQTQFRNQVGDPRAVAHFLSAPGVRPSTLTLVTPAQPAASSGYLFLAPYMGAGAHGPLIADQRGEPVWFHPLPAGVEAANFGVQPFLGRAELVWWQGRILQLGFGQGEDVIYDRSYRPLAVIRAGNGFQADLHVLRLTAQGTAWIDAFYPIHADLSTVGGERNGVLSDGVIQEIDIRTGLVMWEWHALGHVHASETHVHPPSGEYPWDYVHLNSLDPGPSEDVLLSARNTWALYDVDIHSGAVRWRLGGLHSSFKLAPSARFYWQHDGEFQPGGLVSVFDNGSDPPEEKQSRALLLRADPSSRTASVVAQFENPNRTLLSTSQGNALALAGGNWLIGYGGLPDMTEFSPSGQVLLDASLGKGTQNFATFLARWSANPGGRPAVALATSSAGGRSLAVSWNGATRVQAWRVLEGASPRSLKTVLTWPREGFETTLALPGRGPFVEVEALDQHGRTLGRSATIKA